MPYKRWTGLFFIVLQRKVICFRRLEMSIRDYGWDLFYSLKVDNDLLYTVGSEYLLIEKLGSVIFFIQVNRFCLVFQTLWF